MKTSFGGDVFNLWVGFFGLPVGWGSVGNVVRLSGVAGGADGGILLRWGHRRLFFEME